MKIEEVEIKYPRFQGKANHAFKDITNQKFHRLLALYRYKENLDSRAQWVCLCDCGNITLATGKQLRTNTKKSCGCLKKDNMIKMNLESAGEVFGKKFGKLTPLYENGFYTRPNGKRARLIRCKCECGNEIDVQVQYLLYGDTKSCGCIRSAGEFEITQYLLKNNISFKREFSFEDLKLKLPIRFDFAIFHEEELIGLIEFNGEQHYNKRGIMYSDNIVSTDKMKLEYCQEKKIPFYIIKYNDDLDSKLKKCPILQGEKND